MPVTNAHSDRDFFFNFFFFPLLSDSDFYRGGLRASKRHCSHRSGGLEEDTTLWKTRFLN